MVKLYAIDCMGRRTYRAAPHWAAPLNAKKTEQPTKQREANQEHGEDDEKNL